ncbi:MFS transporter [Sphingomonas jaspsi]|uniref:MFS transporter n=1 Tax=Sphingomonas jaspsi TaxID=392409 RepID=UPI0004AFCE2C|nr:MFS transporter [Sphingomonas jaspsi]
MATAAKRVGDGAIGLTILLSAMVLLNYVDRGALGIAAPKLKEELGLDATSFGLAVSAFAWIYAPAQFAVGWMISRVCVYRLVAIGLLVWALATTFTGIVTGLAALVAMRVLLGIGEGVAFPSVSAIIARHVPSHRRGLANSVVSASLAYGPALGTFAGGIILATLGWRPIFLIFGLVTVVWLLPWLVASKPHWRSSDPVSERATMMAVMKQPAAWIVGLGHFANTYGFYFLLAWLPLFLVSTRGLSILLMTEMLTVLYLVQGTAALFVGWLSDRLSHRYDESRVRRSLMAAGHIIGGIAIIGIGNSTTTEALMGWLLLAGIAASPGGSQCYAIAQMYAGKRASGPFVGIMNGIGNTSGIIGPILTGVLVDRFGYHPAFQVAAAISIIGGLWWWFALPRIRPLFDADASSSI